MYWMSAPVETVIKATYLFGGVSTGIGVLAGVVLACLMVSPDHDVPGWLVMGVFALYAVPGVAFLFLANRMSRMEPWAFVATIVMCAVEVMLTLLDLMLAGVGGCCGIAVRMPTLILAAACLNVLPEVRRMYREQRRVRAPRGFEPIMTSPAAPAPGIPAAPRLRTPLRRRGDPQPEPEPEPEPDLPPPPPMPPHDF
jgi:hypothetical protein